MRADPPSWRFPTLLDLPRSRLGGRSSVGRAPGCGPGGRGFEPRRSPLSPARSDVLRPVSWLGVYAGSGSRSQPGAAHRGVEPKPDLRRPPGPAWLWTLPSRRPDSHAMAPVGDTEACSFLTRSDSCARGRVVAEQAARTFGVPLCPSASCRGALVGRDRSAGRRLPRGIRRAARHGPQPARRATRHHRPRHRRDRRPDPRAGDRHRLTSRTRCDPRDRRHRHADERPLSSPTPRAGGLEWLPAERREVEREFRCGEEAEARRLARRTRLETRAAPCQQPKSCACPRGQGAATAGAGEALNQCGENRGSSGDTDLDLSSGRVPGLVSRSQPRC